MKLSADEGRVHPLLARLIEERKARRITQTEIARHIGVSKTSISEIENGHHPNPGMRIFVGYADALGHKLLDDGPEIEFVDWDYRDQPDWDEIALIVAERSFGRVHITMVDDTGGQEYAIAICDRRLEQNEASEMYWAWERQQHEAVTDA